MDRTFTNTDAAIAGSIALVEVIAFIVYVVLAGVKLRNKVISMGRLIPAIPVMIVGNPNIQVGIAQPYGVAPQHQMHTYTPDAPPLHPSSSGGNFNHSDYPPPYASQVPEYKNQI